MSAVTSLWICKRPVIAIAVSFIVGCLWGLSGMSPPPVVVISCLAVCIAILGLMAALGRTELRVLRSMLVLFAVLMAGLLRGGAAGVVREADAVPGVSEHVYFEGVVVSDPEPEMTRAGRERTAFDMRLRDGDAVSASLVGAGRDRVAYGDTLQIEGYLRTGRDGAKYVVGWLDRDGVLATGGGSVVRRSLYRMRRRSAELLSAGIEDFPEQYSILKALVLGYRRGVSFETRERFVETGTLHVFAISGLHVGIACGFAVFVLRSLRIRPSWWFAILAIVLGGYTIMTGASSSAVRACMMALVFYAGALIGRKPDLLCAIAFSALVLVCIDPAYLHSQGFILSFAVAAGICLLGAAMIRRADLLWAADPLLQSKAAPRHVLARWLSGTVCVSLSAWLVSAPLMLSFFGRLSLSGIISNVFIVPVAFLTVLSGCCSMVFGHIALLFSDLFNHASLAMILLLQSIIEMFAAVPFGYAEGLQFSAFQVVLWYLLLGVLTALLNGFFASCLDSGKCVRKS